MYASQFNFEQTVTMKRASTQALAANISAPKKENKSSWVGIFLVMIALTVSTVAMAGSSQPKLAGGNGGATGRP